MAWKTPKTNWVSTDFFEVSDYNRIVANIEYLKMLTEELYKHFNITGMIGNKTYSSYPYPRDFNAIEENIITINESGVKLSMPDATTWVGNMKVPSYVDLNRWEKECLDIYNAMYPNYMLIHRLDFRLGMKERF